MYYSLLDLETTGFSPRLNDKIVEIGILKIDGNGNFVESFETLINPNRDVGATFIHGITANMLCDAPTFDEIAIDVLRILDGSIIVAHNAQFDLRFLEYELNNAGFDIINLPFLCTLQLARTNLDFLPSKKLECLCDYYDIEYVNKHSAMEDCKATCKIFMEFYNNEKIDTMGFEPFVLSNIQSKNLSIGRTLTRKISKDLAKNFKSPFVKLISKLPEIESENDGEKQYLSILDDVLLDRIVTDQELDSILEIAQEYSITKEILQNLNIKYLKNLIRVYLEDNYISGQEIIDIEKVKKILLLDHINTDKIIYDLRKEHSKKINCLGNNKLEGKSVCFTGQLNSKIDKTIISRNKAQEIATCKGLIVKNNVIKNLDYLVLSDVHSQSGKAKKARKYGVSLISENAFWSMLGVQVE